MTHWGDQPVTKQIKVKCPRCDDVSVKRIPTGGHSVKRRCVNPDCKEWLRIHSRSLRVRLWKEKRWGNR